MKEAEVKILEVNRREVERKLRSLGARKEGERDLHAIYFDFPDGLLKERGSTLRLRKEGKTSVLCFKGFISNKGAKIREETETEVSDFDTIRKIIGSLGMTPWLETRKRRITYRLDGAAIEFDKYVGKNRHIPEFIEIEAKSPADIARIARVLGFSRKDFRIWSTVELIRHYSK